MKRKSTAGEFTTGVGGYLCTVKYYHLDAVKPYIGQDPAFSAEGEREEFVITEVTVEQDGENISIDEQLLLLAEKDYYKDHVRIY